MHKMQIMFQKIYKILLNIILKKYIKYYKELLAIFSE